MPENRIVEGFSHLVKQVWDSFPVAMTFELTLQGRMRAGLRGRGTSGVGRLVRGPAGVQMGWWGWWGLELGHEEMVKSTWVWECSGDKKKKNQTGLYGDLDVPSGSLFISFGSVNETEPKISRWTVKVPLHYSCYRFGFCFALLCFLFPHPFSRQCHKIQNQRLSKYMLWEGLQSIGNGA